VIESSLLAVVECSEAVPASVQLVKGSDLLSVVYHTVSVSAEKRSRNKGIMSERQNTVVCSFDPKSPRISALDIYE